MLILAALIFTKIGFCFLLFKLSKAAKESRNIEDMDDAIQKIEDFPPLRFFETIGVVLSVKQSPSYNVPGILIVATLFVSSAFLFNQVK
ncbi:MAG: hypothetical protein HRU19_07985 [Pseudobacteriovorax sp.]|nr:hypothetical protein [Pseudobacteriovorax sp.]